MSNYEGLPVIVEQSVAAGGQLNGSLPSAAPASDQNGLRIYPPEAGANGGLFQAGPNYDVPAAPVSEEREMPWGETEDYRIVEQMVLDMTGLAGAQSWQVDIVSPTGSVTWQSGAGGVTLIVNGDDEHLLLAPDEWLEVSMSAAAAAACWVRIWSRRAKVYGSSVS